MGNSQGKETSFDGEGMCNIPTTIPSSHNTKQPSIVQATPNEKHALTVYRASSEPQPLSTATRCRKGSLWQGTDRREKGHRFALLYTSSAFSARLIFIAAIGLTFALKYIRKDEVVRSESVRNILRERRMLENLNYQFICNLRYSFQDIEYM